LLLVVVIAALAMLTTSIARAELGCLDYPTWEAAQAAHESAPWLGLDADGNGVACECLLYGFPC
jgi:hypothetical protein